jgi:predicted transposase/invertase (TIGR01784 family)
MEVAIEEAHEKGWEEGREEGMEQAAKNLLAMGITVDEIARATGLPLERVRSLASG